MYFYGDKHSSCVHALSATLLVFFNDASFDEVDGVAEDLDAGIRVADLASGLFLMSRDDLGPSWVSTSTFLGFFASLDFTLTFLDRFFAASVASRTECVFGETALTSVGDLNNTDEAAASAVAEVPGAVVVIDCPFRRLGVAATRMRWTFFGTQFIVK